MIKTTLAQLPSVVLPEVNPDHEDSRLENQSETDSNGISLKDIIERMSRLVEDA